KRPAKPAPRRRCWGNTPRRFCVSSLDHIGIAVRSIEEAKKFWVDQLGLKVIRVEEVPEQKVRVALLDAGIELLEPTSPDSPVAKFIEKRGEGLHHVTLQTGKLADRLK